MAVVTDGGHNLPEDFRALAAKGKALAVGIGGNLTGDDEHGTEYASAASLPMRNLRANFDCTMGAAGVPFRYFDEYWERFQGFVTFCEIRDSTATAPPFDLSSVFKRLIGYRAIFARGPSRDELSSAESGRASRCSRALHRTGRASWNHLPSAHPRREVGVEADGRVVHRVGSAQPPLGGNRESGLQALSRICLRPWIGSAMPKRISNSDF